MPKINEKSRKIKLLKEGKNVRAPKSWFNKMKNKIKNQYPTIDKKQINTIVAGIWNKFTTQQKIEIIHEYQKNKKNTEHRRILGKYIK